MRALRRPFIFFIIEAALTSRLRQEVVESSRRTAELSGICTFVQPHVLSGDGSSRPDDQPTQVLIPLDCRIEV